jgi:hypothetical protein
MSKHWSDDLKPVDSEEYKWQNPKTSMIDEFDEDKIKYMVRPVDSGYRLLAFSEVFKGENISATITITDEESRSENIGVIIGYKCSELKKCLEAFKKKM